jgi:hypothetical protein
MPSDFGEAFGIGGQFEGQAAGRLKLSATAESWQTLLSALYADGEFTMDRGVLGGIDLPEAVRRVSSTPATLGGGTRFEQLSGAIRLTPTAYRFSRLVMNAGLMQSTGQLEVSRDLQIRGRMDVQMRGRADHNAKSVSVNGPLKSPLLQTQGAALISRGDVGVAAVSPGRTHRGEGRFVSPAAKKTTLPGLAIAPRPL